MDPLGGVTVNVQVPIVDDSYPGSKGQDVRLYIPSGLQHMDGAAALHYARSRHTTTDLDRAARQQRLLLSMREQADPQALIPKLPDLVKALKGAVKTDIPVDQLDELLGLALADRHGEHQLVRLPAPALRQRGVLARSTRASRTSSASGPR